MEKLQPGRTGMSSGVGAASLPQGLPKYSHSQEWHFCPCFSSLWLLEGWGSAGMGLFKGCQLELFINHLPEPCLFPSTPFPPLWNMIQSVLGCHRAVLSPSSWKNWCPWFSRQYCSVISASSLSFLFSMHLCDPLTGNSSIINTVFFSSSKPPRAVASPGWNVPFNPHFWSNYGSKNPTGRAASPLLGMNGAGCRALDPPGWALGSAHSFGTWSRKKKIKPRQQSPAEEFNMSPASFWSFGTEQAFLNLLFHNEGGFKAVIPYSTILPGTEKVFCILCTAELACCILGTAVAARSNFHYF